MRDHAGLPFAFTEYERRMRELRERMAYRGLDAVVISDPENMTYLTGHQTTGYSFFQALLIPLESEPISVTRQMEASNIEHRTWVEDARYYSDTGDALQMLYSVITELDLERKHVGYERNSYFFPAYQQDRLHTMFEDGALRDCYGIVEAGRLTKSEAEIAIMQKAARATEAGMQAGLDAAGEGVNENDIAAASCAAMFGAGGEYPAVLPYITSGPRTMIGHATWEGRTVQPGEHVFLEMAGCVQRYHTAMMRTVVLGKPSRSMCKAEAIMLKALDEVEELIRPGVTVSDVDNLVRQIISENDIGASLVTRAGYSIGIAFAPSWDEGYMLSLKQGSFEILEAGMTIHIIPWMWGIDGDKTCGISDTIRVTDDGCESFFTLDRRFTVK
ncbi:MAG: ectoine hydrolase [Gammaproteobacteria bacterium]|nr:ectoine hydrolase [Gammaproteobacteria bacterium]